MILKAIEIIMLSLAPVLIALILVMIVTLTLMFDYVLSFEK